MRTGRILDNREHDLAHVGKYHTPFAKPGSPLQLDSVRDVQPFGRINRIPSDKSQRRKALI